MGRVLRALVLVGLAVAFFALALLMLSEAGASEAQEEPCYAFAPVPGFRKNSLFASCGGPLKSVGSVSVIGLVLPGGV
jgi:hypothetical protein